MTRAPASTSRSITRACRRRGSGYGTKGYSLNVRASIPTTTMSSGGGCAPGRRSACRRSAARAGAARRWRRARLRPRARRSPPAARAARAAAGRAAASTAAAPRAGSDSELRGAAHVRYVRAPLRTVPRAVTIRMRTITVPRGRPRRSTGAVMRSAYETSPACRRPSRGPSGPSCPAARAAGSGLLRG